MQIDSFENLKRIIRKEPPGWIPFTLDVGGVKGFSETIMDLFKEKTGKMILLNTLIMKRVAMKDV